MELDDLQGPFQPEPFYDSMISRTSGAWLLAISRNLNLSQCIVVGDLSNRGSSRNSNFLFFCDLDSHSE